jgi:hypothetical protein
MPFGRCAGGTVREGRCGPWAGIQAAEAFAVLRLSTALLSNAAQR